MRALFALALLSLDGLGRVTAHRLLGRFASPEAIRATPREQVFLRIKGAPNAASLVDRLLGAELDDALTAAEAAIARDASRGIATLAPGSLAWPSGLDGLPPSSRPVLLRAYGALSALDGPLLSVLAAPPLDAASFEGVERLVGVAAARGVAPVVGAENGVDVALMKRSAGSGRPAIAVAGAGLASIERSIRPAATQLTRAGGLLVSPFAMTHGPFEHDLRERALVAAALGRTVCAVAPAAGSPEDAAAAWAAEAGRPLVALSPGDAAWVGRARVAGTPTEAERLAEVV